MRVWVMLPLLAASMAAHAEWVRMGENHAGVQYVDPATIVKDGDRRRIARLENMNQREPSGEMSIRIVVEYDCKGKRTRTVESQNFAGPMGTGKVMYGYKSPQPWRDVLPGSRGDEILKFACARQTGGREEKK